MPPAPRIVQHFIDEATNHHDEWGVTFKRAIELQILKYVMFTRFAKSIDLPDAANTLLVCDHRYDGGLDEFFFDEGDGHLILIQLKVSDPEDFVWAPTHNMNDEDQLKLSQIFWSDVVAGTHDRYIAEAGGDMQERLMLRYNQLREYLESNQITRVTICNIVAGTFGGNTEQVRAQIEREGREYHSIDWNDIESAYTHFQTITNSDQAVDDISLKFDASYCSANSEIRDLDLMDEDRLQALIREHDLEIGSVDEMRTNIRNVTASTVLGYAQGESIANAVRDYGSSLTLANLRHFLGVGKGGVKSNDGMVSTLTEFHTKFHHRNNGLRITCRGISVGETVDGWTSVRLLNPQIVNGGQTSWVLYNHSLQAGGVDRLRETRVLVLGIKVENDDEQNAIAIASNTQASLDKWAFHANSQLQREFKEQLAAVQFQSEGEDCAFYYAIKEGEFDTLSNDDKSRFQVPKNGQGQRSKYLLKPVDDGGICKLILCLRGEPTKAYNKGPYFASLPTEQLGGLYNEIFDNLPPARVILYAKVVWHSVVALTKTFKENLREGELDVWTNAKEVYTTIFFKLMMKAHDVERIDELFPIIEEHYWPSIDWEGDGAGNGRKVADVTEPLVGSIFGRMEQQLRDKAQQTLTLHGWQDGSSVQSGFKLNGFLSQVAGKPTDLSTAIVNMYNGFVENEAMGGAFESWGHLFPHVAD